MSLGADRCTFDRGELERILRERGLIDVSVRFILAEFPEDWSCGSDLYRNGNRCIFHTEDKEPSEFMNEFRKELERMESEQDKLDFTGFTFPQMDFYEDGKPIIFSKPTRFAGATFQGLARFDGATFQHGVNFPRSTFMHGASFVGCRFSKIVDFSYAIFEEQVFFRKSE